MTRETGTAGNLAPAPVLELEVFLGVTTTFHNAVIAFNQQELRRLEDLLAENVRLYKVNSGIPVSGGKAAVIEYLERVMVDKPIFAPVTTALHPPTLPTSVRGVALWRRSDKATSTALSIKYEFFFQPDAPYLITSLWAKPR
jgi:hypothetical protein